MYKFITKQIASGYVESTETFPVMWLKKPPFNAKGNKSILIFCPSYVSRGDYKYIQHVAEQLIVQASQIKEKYLDLTLAIGFGIQYKDDQEEFEAIERFQKLDKLVKDDFNFYNFIQYGSGKTHSLNEAIYYAYRNDFDGILQIDDDVSFEDYSFTNIITEYYKREKSAVCGAKKKFVFEEGKASKLFKFSKKQVKSPIDYPHACCMLFNPKDFPKGIPLRYISDDGYVCFKKINTQLENPVKNLVIVEDCVCLTTSGGQTKEVTARIRRIMLSHILLLADFPASTSKYFLKNILFSGFWPISPLNFKRNILGFFIRYIFQFIYLIWLLTTAFELIARGLLKIPIKEIKWSGIDLKKGFLSTSDFDN